MLWPLKPSEDLANRLMDLALTCGEIWNMGLQQRRNKYAWGKADFPSQQAEISLLQQEDPQLAAYPLAALSYPVWRLDQDYQYFLQELAAFKKRQRPTMPPLPQPWPEETPFPIYLAATDLERTGDTGIWQWPTTSTALPLTGIPDFKHALIHLLPEPALEMLDNGP